MCTENVFCMYQCLDECVSVSSLFPTEMWKYVIGHGCKGQMKKVRGILSVIL